MQLWKRNLYVVWLAELVALAGFSLIQPFIPYFIQELGVTDLAQVELYSGLAMSVHAFTMAIFAPIWGSLADRYGRKIMVERATFGGAILFALMAFATDVPSLLFLRALQGCVTGTVAAAMTLVASNAPKERSGYALGTLQMAVYLGTLLGPLAGGLIADTWGYRAAFYVTSVALTIAGVLVLIFVEERFQPVAAHSSDGGLLHGLRLVLASPTLLSIFALRIALRVGDRSLNPILPIFVQSLLPVGSKAASATGMIMGAGAASSALGAVVLGRASDQVGYRHVLLLCSFGAAVFYMLQYNVVNTGQLLMLYSLAGFMLGGTITAITAMLAHQAPEGRHGAVYGIDSSAVSVANFLGPMIGASIAMFFGLRPSFLFVAAMFLLGGLAVARMVPSSK